MDPIRPRLGPGAACRHRRAALAAAFTGGTTRVTFDGRTVEYRSLDELGRALSVLHAAENAAARRPSVTFASFSRRGKQVMGRLRQAWQALRGYAAAQDSRASSWAASGGSANGEVGAAAPTVARRARDAVRNDPYAARIVDLWTGNAVGAGITTRWPDKPHAEAWRRWSDSTACDAEGRLDLYGLQALVMRAVVESGECFVRLLPADITPANPIGLRLQVLESDHLDTARNGMVEGLPTLQGIALGDAGDPVAYWLHRIHPGASWLLPSGGRLTSEAVPAQRRAAHLPQAPPRPAARRLLAGPRADPAARPRRLRGRPADEGQDRGLPRRGGLRGGRRGADRRRPPACCAMPRAGRWRASSRG